MWNQRDTTRASCLPSPNQESFIPSVLCATTAVSNPPYRVCVLVVCLAVRCKILFVSEANAKTTNTQATGLVTGLEAGDLVLPPGSCVCNHKKAARGT